MEQLKGGRGQKAPWESTHIRCPIPIANQIRDEINRWKSEQLGGSEVEHEKLLTDFDSVINTAKKILKQKKSARISIEKLLTEIYGETVNLS